MENSNFLINTAKDYDMSFIEVKNIYKNHKGLDFYNALEQALKDRRNT